MKENQKDEASDMSEADLAEVDDVADELRTLMARIADEGATDSDVYNARRLMGERTEQLFDQGLNVARMQAERSIRRRVEPRS